MSIVTFYIVQKYENRDYCMENCSTSIQCISDTQDNINKTLELMRNSMQQNINTMDETHKCEITSKEIQDLKDDDIILTEKYANGSKYDWFKKTLIYKSCVEQTSFSMAIFGNDPILTDESTYGSSDENESENESTYEKI